MQRWVFKQRQRVSGRCAGLASQQVSCDCARPELSVLCFQQGVEFRDDWEGVGYIDHVGFATGPAAVGVERNGAALGDETPTDNVGFLAVAAGCEALGMAGRGAGLADLIHMSEEGKNWLAFATLVDKRLAAAEGCAGLAKEAEN